MQTCAFEAFDRAIENISKDKRGGSRPGRVKRKPRLPCNWYKQYLDPETAVYSERDFRDTFGVTKLVFRFANFLLSSLNVLLMNGRLHQAPDGHP